MGVLSVGVGVLEPAAAWSPERGGVLLFELPHCTDVDVLVTVIIAACEEVEVALLRDAGHACELVHALVVLCRLALQAVS